MEYKIKPTPPSNGLTLKEVGDAMDVTRERVRQIEAKALTKLRKKLNTRNIGRINHIL
jgi:DNA-directed RNA polymerase sigma subunit (sigma70/sigma32)